MLIDELAGYQAASTEHAEALLTLPDCQLAACVEGLARGCAYITCHLFILLIKAGIGLKSFLGI